MEQEIIFFLVALIASLAIFGFGVLIGRRVKRPADLEPNEQIFQKILETAPIGICIIRERRFAFVNDIYFRMFGYESSDEVVGRFVEELYAEEERARQRSYARDRIAGKPVPTIYETVGLRKNGEKFEVSAWVSLIRYQGQLSSLGFIIDRSDETEMRRRLDHANRLEALGTMAGGIAHDFNNILTAIIGYSELALLRSKDDQIVSADINQVLKAGHRAKDLIRQILSFSRKQDQLTRVVRLSAVVDEVVRMLRVTLPTSIAIKVKLASKINILADPTRIHQLIMNLCANAEHTMRTTGGVLTIEVTNFNASQGSEKEYPGLIPGEYALLKVYDTGRGIPTAIKEKICEPFFTTKEVGEGTGMGLAQVHAIACSHGGYLSFTDNKPNGSVFSVFFPVVGGEEETMAEAKVRPSSGNCKILLVDDEPMVLEVTERTLCELGYDVVVGREGKEALAIFEQNPDRFDLVISDMTMPCMTGDKLAAKIKALRPAMPVVLCSGNSAAIEKNSKVKAIVTILEKPIDKNLLAETVSRLLDGSQSNPETKS
ncbi:MAG: PAS domain S-box-containing protein [Desulforhopalus sp.]|jgi:PAS domain S-box-containing protein